MAYTPQKPDIAFPSSELRNSIIGWGADLDPKNRPAVPKEHYNPEGTGAHWEFPERQIPKYRREKSTEHKFLTPVFGTVCPPRGLSGLIRRYAYTYSEGRMAHWTLLVLADRIDVLESAMVSLLRGRPDNPFAEIGLKAEVKRHGLRSRRGQHRTDLKHQPIDILLFAGKGLVLAGAGFALVRGIQKLSSRRW